MVRFNEGNYSGAIYYYYERVKEFWDGNGFRDKDTTDTIQHISWRCSITSITFARGVIGKTLSTLKTRWLKRSDNAKARQQASKQNIMRTELPKMRYKH